MWSGDARCSPDPAFTTRSTAGVDNRANSIRERVDNGEMMHSMPYFTDRQPATTTHENTALSRLNTSPTIHIAGIFLLSAVIP